MIYKYIKQYHLGFFVVIFTYVIKHSPVPLMPILTALMIDLAILNPPNRDFWLMVYGGIIISLWVLNIPMHTWYFSQLSHITRSVGRDLRIRICRQLQSLSLLFHNRTNIGKLHSKAIRDIELIEQTPFLFFDTMLSFAMTLIFAIGAIIWKVPIALLFFAFAVPLAAFLRFIFKRKMQDRIENFRLSVEEMSGSMNEMLKMIPVARSHGMEEREIDQMESKITNVFAKSKEFDMMRAIFSSCGTATMLILQTLFLMGSIYACFYGFISVGTVVMFNSFFLALSGQLAMVIGTIPQLTQGYESLQSVEEIINAPEIESNENKTQFESITGKFEFQNVSYQYPETKNHAINSLNLTVESGSSTAFVGPSGAGKSTMLSLLLGLIKPNEGQLFLDGLDMSMMDLRTYRRFVGVVSQEDLLFSGSLYENIAFTKWETSEEEVWQALEMANASEFVKELPQQIHTPLGADGIQLSGGQRQRLSIARAIIRDPKILILDEATSALDHESELIVQESLNQIMKNRTTFIVSHRISTTRDVDRIIVMDQGQIIYDDSPENLLKTQNFYSKAVRSEALLSHNNIKDIHQA